MDQRLTPRQPQPPSSVAGMNGHTPRRRRTDTLAALLVPVAEVVEPETIVHRPDGYYWCALDGHQQCGPFDTFDAAQTDRDAVSEEAVAPGQSLHEVEQTLGVADWLDPETGEPAEGQSPPHLSDE